MSNLLPKNRLSAFVIVFAFTVLPTFATAQVSRFQEIFETFVHKHPRFAIGASYAIENGKPVSMVAGPTYSGGTELVLRSARWHIGSIGKSITSTLVMRLVDQGKLDLDAPIERYFPSFRDSMHSDWKSQSLRRLLSHTSGLPVAFPSQLTNDIFAYASGPGKRAALSAMWETPSDGTVGEFAYSNVGYVLAGLVIEEVTGMSWETAIRTEIAEPLGLDSLGVGAPNHKGAPLGHKSFLGFKSSVSPDDRFSDNPEWMGPAGTIHLSLADLAAWGRFHLNACAGERPDVLSQSGCREMQSPVSENYGLGWVILETDKWGPIISHSGSNGLWQSAIYLMPDRDVVVSVTANAQLGEEFEQLARDLTLSLISGLQ